MSRSIELEIQDAGRVDSVLSYARHLISKAIQSGAVAVILGRPSKTREQEEKYHAMIGDIAKTVFMPVIDSDGHIVPNLTKKRDRDHWKAVLVDDFEQELKAQGIKLRKPSRIIRSLDGSRWITERASTKDFTVEHGSMFIEYLYAKGIELGATFSEKAKAYYDEVAQLCPSASYAKPSLKLQAA